MSVKEAFRLDDLQHTGAVMQRTGVVTVVIIEEKTYKWFSTTVQVKYVQMPFANSLTADYKSIRASPQKVAREKDFKGGCTNISTFASTAQKGTEPREMAVQNIHRLLSCTGPRNGHASNYSKTLTAYFLALAQEVAMHQPIVKHQPPPYFHALAQEVAMHQTTAKHQQPTTHQQPSVAKPILLRAATHMFHMPHATESDKILWNCPSAQHC